MNVTLNLWVSNQVGVDADETANYLIAALEDGNWEAWEDREDIRLDWQGQTLAGEAEVIYAAFRDLAKGVAKAGHGLDSEEEEEEVGPAILTACPVDLIQPGYMCAAELLARQESARCKTWGDYAAKVLA